MFLALSEVNVRQIAIVAIATTGLGLTSPAFAEKVDISGTHSKSEIKTVCDNAGGTYSEVSDGYSCNNKNKNTQVYCWNDGKCFGFVPGRQVPLGGILTGALPANLADPNMSSLTNGDNGGGHNGVAGSHNLANAGGLHAGNSGLSNKP